MMKRVALLAGSLGVWAACNCGGPGPADGGEGGGAGGGSNSAGGSTSGGGAGGDRTWAFRFSPDGGTFVAGAYTLTVPAGALGRSVEVTVRESLSTTIPGRTLTSPVYFFEPEGLEFSDAVHVQVDVSDQEVGIVRWSGEDGGPDESIGWVVSGVGEGYTRHFSRSYTAKGACIDPNGPGRSRCDCRATDCQGDLLEKHQPDASACGDYPNDTKWEGADGGACTGWGRRTIEVWQCDCTTLQNVDLCPVRWVGTTFQSTCPMGTRTFDGGRIQCDGGPNVVGRTCSGFQQTPFNQTATGRLQSCGRAAVDTVWEEVDGVLEGCTEVGLPAGTMVCPAGTPQRERVSQACFQALSQYMGGGSCPQFGEDTATTGTRLGQQIEAQFNQPPNQLTQLSVPGASKSAKCDAGNPGYPDIVRVVRRTPTSVTVQLGDVKPLSRSGLAKGLNDVYSCYQDAFDRAAAKCAPDAGRTPADTTFCNQLGALNRTVTVDRSGNLGFTPGQFCGQATDGGPLKVEAMECQPGVTAYRCFP